MKELPKNIRRFIKSYPKYYQDIVSSYEKIYFNKEKSIEILNTNLKCSEGQIKYIKGELGIIIEIILLTSMEKNFEFHVGLLVVCDGSKGIIKAVIVLLNLLLCIWILFINPEVLII